MGPELWVLVAAVFVSGGAVGAAGTLLAQWLLKKVTQPEAPRLVASDQREVVLLRGDVTDLNLKVENLDARLDFQEQLLGGGIPTTSAPARLTESPSRKTSSDLDPEENGEA